MFGSSQTPSLEIKKHAEKLKSLITEEEIIIVDELSIYDEDEEDEDEDSIMIETIETNRNNTHRSQQQLSNIDKNK